MIPDAFATYFEALPNIREQDPRKHFEVFGGHAS